ncbi:alpha/beta hydrolase [Hazenella coriacea]|nr:alpha/beta fold hydrolase [Hazenella coriacea]
MEIIQRSPDPFFYKGGKTGILLIHGFSGSPSEMRPMGEYFKEQGYTVCAPLLAGHGTTPEDMEKTYWPDWWQSVLDAYERTLPEVEELFVAGLSMGGALSLYLASQKSVAGVIPMCAPVWVQDRRAVFAGVIHHFIPYKKRKIRRAEEIERHMVTYDRTPVKCVGSLNRLIRMVRQQLPKVSAPALVIQSQMDEVVVPKSAEYIHEHISSTEKELSWYEKSSHIITLDKERKKLFAEVDGFIQRHSQFSNLHQYRDVKPV